MNIPKILQMLRESGDLSQADMAQVFDLSQQTYSNVETGKTKRLTARLLAQIQELAYGRKRLQDIFVENGGNTKSDVYKKISKTPIYIGDKNLNDNNNLTKKIKYSQTLDNDNSLQLTLNPPREKRIKLLNNDYEINLDSFSATLPTRSDTNGWLPVIADVESLMDLQEAIDKGDKRLYDWPMETIEIVRDPNVKGQYRLKAPPYDNFYPLIRAGEWITITRADKYKYKTSVTYLVLFKDRTFMLYYLAQGSTKDKVVLISENSKYGQREYDIEEIHSIYAVSPRI